MRLPIAKSRFLQRAGAQVRVVDEADFDESQIDTVVLVIAATDNRELNRRISEAAQARHRLVNVVDDRPLCSFIFPSIVDRSPLLVAISSGGTAPVLARVLREKIEALLPTSLGRMAEKASFWRNHLKTRLTSVTERRRFWERVFRGRFASLMHAGNETAAQQILEDELDNPGSSGGEIILVGAGPGDAGLLTLRGLQVLQDARCGVLRPSGHRRGARIVRRDAEQICVGKRRASTLYRSNDTTRCWWRAAKAGKNGGAALKVATRLSLVAAGKSCRRRLKRACRSRSSRGSRRLPQ